MNKNIYALLLLMSAGTCFASSEPESKREEVALADVAVNHSSQSSCEHPDQQIANEIMRGVVTVSIEKGGLGFSKAFVRCEEIKDPRARLLVQNDVLKWVLSALERTAQDHNSEINELKERIRDLEKKEGNDRCCIVQ